MLYYTVLHLHVDNFVNVIIVDLALTVAHGAARLTFAFW